MRQKIDKNPSQKAAINLFREDVVRDNTIAARHRFQESARAL